MKHLSDESIAKELEQLSEAFLPSPTQKEKMRRQIATQTVPKKSFHIKSLLPTFLSLVVLFSVGLGFYINLSETESNDVTASWNKMVMLQFSYTSATNYVLIFDGSTLTIEDIFVNNPGFPLGYKYKVEEPLLSPGTYDNYTISQKGDTYTLEVFGETGFTYTFEKVGPRILRGEDGIEFSTTIYLDTDTDDN